MKKEIILQEKQPHRGDWGQAVWGDHEKKEGNWNRVMNKKAM